MGVNQQSAADDVAEGIPEAGLLEEAKEEIHGQQSQQYRQRIGPGLLGVTNMQYGNRYQQRTQNAGLIVEKPLADLVDREYRRDAEQG